MKAYEFLVGSVDSRSKYLPLHMTLTEPHMKCPLDKFQEQLRMQSRSIHKLTQKILTEPKNPKLYPHARKNASKAHKDRKTPGSILKKPLGNVQSSSIKTEIFVGFNYMPDPDNNDHFFFENYVILPKERQPLISHDFSIKFVIFALNDIREAEVNLKFYGLRPTFNFKKREKFESINYDAFKNLDLEMPDRLAHLSKRTNRRRFRMIYQNNKVDEPAKTNGNMDSIIEDGTAEGEQSKVDNSFDANSSVISQMKQERSVKFPQII
jgi:hypothetical protein